MASPLASSVPVPRMVVAVLEGHRAGRRAGARGYGVTVAVKVTDWPKTDGLAEEVKRRRRAPG